jgi:hypothetical protein
MGEKLAEADGRGGGIAVRKKLKPYYARGLDADNAFK